MRKFLLIALFVLAEAALFHQHLSAQSVGGAISNPPASTPPSGAAGGVLSGTYPNPGFAAAPSFATSATVAGGTVTTSAPVLNLTQTWNGSGLTFTGILGNFVSTASNANSMLLDLQAGGVTQFNVTRGGGLTLTGNIAGTSSNRITYGTATWTNVPLDTALTTTTLCKSTADNTMRTGSGTAGICLGTSSARFKHDIQPLLVSGLDAVSRLRPVSYRYNPGYGAGNELYGFIAEQVDGVLPKLVGKGSDGAPNTLDMLGVVPVLVLAIQELQAEVAALKETRR